MAELTAKHAPYRADHVGSILRTERLKQAREDRAAGAITAEQLREVEDEEIYAIVEKQKEAGLTAITDGDSVAPGGTSISLKGLTGWKDTNRNIAINLTVLPRSPLQNL